ncbi:MAG: AAA family ATPase [Archaeoglobaceae archaeon]|nr:AAA family ATPase [Archaeoglobaceae archaeon]MCX8152068.1 AAA family ATPase [Archaeoglobaceae archaeon]MDW8013833.1 AAA family ATPase [Archaeoglobaceae archaeon]
MDYEYIFEDVIVKESNAPRFLLNGEEVDIWDNRFQKYHSKSVVDYIREKLLEYEKKKIDLFPEIVGKKAEKEMVKTALLSGSNILFKGRKGYGKTTFSKAIAKLLPEKILAIKGCKIHDDPTRPVCFSCKRKILEKNEVELTFIPRKWIRIAGDPMMTTRQLIGGISIQKIKEGYDLDHPEVFTPGRVLKAHRGIAYFDELGAIPSALQTLLHELIEEKQITTPEGDIVPMKIDIIAIASTNPANYKGVADIKEPLLDRMEQIDIGPPETIDEEIEIGLRNMNLKRGPVIPEWHLKILAGTVRCMRSKKCRHANRIEVEPSCRATIKLFDHVRASAMRNMRESVMFKDYGDNFENVKLALKSRIGLDYEEEITKDEVIVSVLNDTIDLVCSEIYALIPRDVFKPMIDEIANLKVIDVYKSLENGYVSAFAATLCKSDAELLSAVEITLEAIARCTGLLERKGVGIYEYTGYNRQ